MLFDDDLPEDVQRGLRSLRGAADMEIPWPYDEQQDLALLRRLKEKFPQLAVDDLVDKFLAWCLDAVFWTESKTTIRWRSRLWTWAVNDGRYRQRRTVERASTRERTARAGRTHHVAAEGRHGDATEAVDEW